MGTRFIAFGALALFLCSAGCAPPHGFGHHVLPGGEGSFAAGAALDYGYTTDRHVLQVDLSGGGQLKDWFSMEAGIRYTALRAPGIYTDQRGDSLAFEHSALPYVSPIFHLGPVTVAMSFSALPLIGPEAGIAVGYGSLVTRYDADHWGVYLGMSGHGVMYLTRKGELNSTYWQAGGGAQYEFIVNGFLLGISGEVFYGDQEYRYKGPWREQRFVMGLLGVRLGYKGR